MAAASGQPQDTKVKKEITPEQRKTYTMLGVLGVLALIAGGIYVPGMLSGGGSTPDTSTTGNATISAANTATNAAPGSAVMPSSGTGSGITDEGSVAEAGGATLVGAATTSLGGEPIARAKTDPFQQNYLYPTPAPTPPPPVDVPAPLDSAPVFLPGTNIAPAELRVPLNLPPVAISRFDDTVKRPTDAFPPRRSSSSGGSAQSVTPSFDKRLSGVVIGDGVRALLEITGANGIVTRVVQPGDEVDGITVLSIQRFNDGTRTVTRMLIRENGEERSVELRAGVQQQTTGAEGGLGGPGGLGGTGEFGRR